MRSQRQAGSSFSVTLVMSLAIVAASVFADSATVAIGASGKVEKLIADLQRVSSAQQAVALVEEAKLSDAEGRQLAIELEKPQYSGMIKRLKQSATTLAKGKPPTPRLYAGKSVDLVVKEKKLALEQERQRVLAAANQQLQTRVTRLRTTTMAAGVRPAPVIEPITQVAGASIEDLRRNGPYVDRVYPRRVQAGETATIQGFKFGRERGTVTLRMNGHALTPPEIQSWSDERIVVRIPTNAIPYHCLADVPDNVGNNSGDASLAVDARLGVKHQGGALESLGAVEVMPDLAPLSPTITSISPMNATPGCALVVEGSNFGSSTVRGRLAVWAALEFGANNVPIEPEEWRDTYIVFRVPADVRGLFPQDGGKLSLKNRIGLRANKVGLTFTPAEEIVEVRGGPYRAWCHPALIPPLCLIGESKEVTFFDRELRNGWKVDDSWLATDTAGANAGAYFQNQPERGDVRVFYRIVVWADAYSRVECQAFLTLKGPAGTNYR